MKTDYEIVIKDFRARMLINQLFPVGYRSGLETTTTESNIGWIMNKNVISAINRYFTSQIYREYLYIAVMYPHACRTDV